MWNAASDTVLRAELLAACREGRGEKAKGQPAPGDASPACQRVARDFSTAGQMQGKVKAKAKGKGKKQHTTVGQLSLAPLSAAHCPRRPYKSLAVLLLSLSSFLSHPKQPTALDTHIR